MTLKIMISIILVNKDSRRLIIIKEAKDYLQKYLEKNLVLIEKEATHH
jgi:hypothetical protein